MNETASALSESPSPNPFPKLGEGESEATSPDLERGVGVRILQLAVNGYSFKNSKYNDGFRRSPHPTRVPLLDGTGIVPVIP